MDLKTRNVEKAIKIMKTYFKEEHYHIIHQMNKEEFDHDLFFNSLIKDKNRYDLSTFDITVREAYTKKDLTADDFIEHLCPRENMIRRDRRTEADSHKEKDHIVTIFHKYKYKDGTSLFSNHDIFSFKYSEKPIEKTSEKTSDLLNFDEVEIPIAKEMLKSYFKDNYVFSYEVYKNEFAPICQGSIESILEWIDGQIDQLQKDGFKDINPPYIKNISLKPYFHRLSSESNLMEIFPNFYKENRIAHIYLNVKSHHEELFPFLMIYIDPID